METAELITQLRYCEKLVQGLTKARNAVVNIPGMEESINNIVDLLNKAELRKRQLRLTLPRRKKKKKASDYNEATRLKHDFIKNQKNIPCKDCGERKASYLMSFDHLPECSPKLFTIGDMDSIADRSWQEIKEEIAKCEVVCRDCHDLREVSRER